ncbi:hypothetical protein C6P46_006842 [Rhodotorula mucilaginosa]|uniref:Neuroguidin-like protein n=1 Tax=Rhodotorula mucilaginosa TaxID=5537 RepID=A0A9P6W5T8_RHOMI|nr:hypothetical protein C6P46_006842 [Rhodotorula mucilaginosa]TKA53177.1 hypothetical protein B0A53_04033 [Rhodotorula sp. CCFEE 5036]
MARSVSPEQHTLDPQVAALRAHLAEIRNGVQQANESALAWKQKRAETDELDYAAGISLLSLKNHLLLSYLQHLVALFSLKLSSKSLVQSEPAARVVAHLVKLRVVLEKVAPLELKLKYQVEKLVRKADQFDDQGGAQNEEDVLNDPLAFRPNPSNLVLDRTVSEGEDEEEADERAGIYRPPRLAAMPYVEAPAKGKKKREAAQQPSHLLSDMSHSMLSSTPYAEATSGLSVSYDPSLKSGAKARLDKILEYETSNFRRLGKSKKDERDRRRMEEEVAFGGLGAGKGGKRRLGGFGAEFDDLLGHGNTNNGSGGASQKGEKRKAAAYEQMAGFKKPKMARPERDFDGPGSSGLGGGAGGAGKRTKSQFDKAVKRANSKRS